MLAEAVKREHEIHFGFGSLTEWRRLKDVKHPPRTQVLYVVPKNYICSLGLAFERKADAPSSDYSKERLKGITEVFGFVREFQPITDVAFAFMRSWISSKCQGRKSCVSTPTSIESDVSGAGSFP